MCAWIYFLHGNMSLYLFIWRVIDKGSFIIYFLFKVIYIWAWTYIHSQNGILVSMWILLCDQAYLCNVSFFILFKRKVCIFFFFFLNGRFELTHDTPMPLTSWATAEGRLIFHYIQLWQGVNWGITKQAVNIMVIWQSYYWLVFPLPIECGELTITHHFV